MEIGEFEFDISNVAAFESVATENPIQDEAPILQQEHKQQQSDPRQTTPIEHSPPHSHQEKPPSPLNQQQSQQTRILLVPINPGKQLYQLATLSTSGNKQQIIQLAPIQANQLASPNTTKQSKLQQTPQTTNLNLQQNDHLINQTNLNKSTTTISETTNELPKRKPCNCTKSQCLKLYCDCFANGEFCSGCNCTNCFNSLSREKERQKAISQCLERNPEAFRPKIGKAVKASQDVPVPESIERQHTKGCNCKRSGCLKNYCECYEAKILCSNLCKCCGCKNYEENFDRKSIMHLATSQSENARGILKSLLPTNSNLNSGKKFAKCFITDKVINASLVCLLQSAQQAERNGLPENTIPKIIYNQMGECFRMIVDSAMTCSSINS